MKKVVIFAAVLVILGAYSYFQIIQPESLNKTKVVTSLLQPESVEVSEITITNGDQEVRLAKKDDFWWVMAPQHYLGNQEYIEKGLQIMRESNIKNSFAFKDDFFGLTPGKAFLSLKYGNGLNSRLRVGTKSAPGEHIYVLDEDSQKVSVVHNVWGQFLYYPLERFYHPFLPIPGNLVKTVQLKRAGKQVWHLSPSKGTKMAVQFKGKTLETPKAQWLWFFSKLREFPLKNIKFDHRKDFESAQELEIRTDKGNIRFVFNEKGTKLFVPSLNVFAEVDPYSLKSLDHEVAKVVENDKK